MTGRSAVQAVVLAYGEEPYLSTCVEAVLASVEDGGVPVDLVVTVVDNGAADSIATLPSDDRIRVLRPGKNLGFAGGCNFAAAASDSELIVFVNSDAIVRPDAVGRLCRAVEDPRVALACGGVRLADEPELMNSAGNPVHFVGAVWSGGYGEPAAQHAVAEDVASISGAFFATRRSTWAELDGFDGHYFAYHEDADLSLRAWLRGYRVRFVPEAVATHHYEFSRTPSKFYLLERNRWITVLTVFPARVLWAVGPALIAFEACTLVGAARLGFVRQKLRGYRWLVAHAYYLRSRRRAVQSAVTMSGADFADLLSSRIDTQMLGDVPGMEALNRVLAGYWALARRLCGIRTGRPVARRSARAGRIAFLLAGRKTDTRLTVVGVADPTSSADGAGATAGRSYTDRLRRLDGAAWKRVLNVQAPYRWNIRRLNLGRTLDVGCGLGRNLAYLPAGSVGVDHNPDSVAVARSRGLQAHVADEFMANHAADRGTFDSLLFAHVIEHLSATEAEGILETYLPWLRDGGRVCFITPQERGYRSDETHVRFTDFGVLRQLCGHAGLSPERQYSFPLPRFMGKLFTYNEFALIARKQ